VDRLDEMSSPPPAPAKRLAGDAAVLATVALLTQGASMLGTIALARILPLGEFGLYQQLLLLYAIVAPLLFGGVPAALTYYLSRSTTEEERAGWTFDATVALAALGLLFALLLVLLRAPLADLLHRQGKLAVAIALLAPYTLFTFIAAVAPNALIPTGRARLSALLSGVSALIYLGCVITAAATWGDVRALSLAMGVSGAISAVLAMGVVGHVVGYRVRWRGVGRRVTGFLAYGLPLALTGLAGLLGYQFDRLVIGAQFSPEVFAIYAVGAVELPLAAAVQQSVNSVLLPELAVRHRDGDIAGLGMLWREAIRKTSLILLPAFVICMILADDIVRVAFGARFSESADIFRIYLLLMPLRVATYGLIPMAIGRTRINLTASLVVLGSNVVLALALVGPLGVKGPAWATVIATALTVAFYLVRLRSLLHLSIAALFPWRILASTLLVSAIAGLPIVALAGLETPPVVRAAVGATAYAALSVLALRLTRRITDDDWSRLLRALRLRQRVRPAAASPS
jgi:O-antigen/teichoic acid export membrane protein